MEPTVRNPRIESAIGSDAARSLHLSRRFPSAGWSVAVPNSVAGNGIFGCRDRRPRIRPSDHYCRQRPGTLKIGDKIPAETPSFRWTLLSGVREDWVVVCAVICEPVIPRTWIGAGQRNREYSEKFSQKQGSGGLK